MFQRVQSLYLVISIAVLSIVYFLSFGEIIIEQSEIYDFSVFEITSVLTGENIVTTLPLVILVIVIQLLLFMALFLFKKRLIQVRLCIFSIIATIGLYGLLAFYLIKLMNNFDLKFQFSYALIFPLIALFFMIFAIRAIKKDEKLVRSVDRIR